MVWLLVKSKFMLFKENYKILVEICYILVVEGLILGVGLLCGKVFFKVSVLDVIEVIKVFNL